MDATLLYNVAKMYYEENLSQQEIANRTGISRPQISRLLKEAREMKIVNIEIRKPFSVGGSELSERLRDILGISDIRIVTSPQLYEDEVEKRLDHVVDYAASLLTQRVGQCGKIAIGWGRTIYSLVLKMPFCDRRTDLCIVPLAGSAGLDNPAFQSNSIVDRMAEKLGTDKQFINAPAFLSDKRLFDAILSAPAGRLKTIWEDIDLAVFSLGSFLGDNPSFAEFIGNNEIVDRIIAAKPTGDVVGRYYDQNGVFLDELSTYNVAVPPKKLLEIPSRLCVAIGSHKVGSIIAASKNGIFTELITDSFTASAIIRHV